MTTLALLQDPVGGGVATVAHWYRQWMARHDPDYLELYLDEQQRGGVRRLRAWTPEAPAIPRVLPRLHLPQYWCAARQVARVELPAISQVHVIGASVAHGTLVPKPRSLVWLATLFDDERRSSVQLQTPARRALYRATRAPLARLESKVLGHADRVLAMSHHTADLIVQRGLADAAAVEVVPVPIDGERYRPPPADHPRRGLLYVGRANDPRKGFDRLMALATTSAAVRDRGVTVVSSGPQPPLPAGVRWAGSLDDLRPAYQDHELFVLPSYQEGLGIVAFEALACGTPVVAWRCGGPDRFLEDSGGAVVVDSASQFQQAAQDLLADPARRAEMGSAGRDYIEAKFSGANFLADPAVFALA